jgi:hypothetical protein
MIEDRGLLTRITGEAWNPGKHLATSRRVHGPLVLGAVSPEAVVTCMTPPAVGSS